MKFRNMLAAATLLTPLAAAGATLVASDIASAHSNDSYADCNGIHGRASSYESHDTNTMTIYLDGSIVYGPQTFGVNHSKDIAVPQDGVAHTWRVIVDSSDDTWDRDTGTKNVGPCGEVPPPPPDQCPDGSNPGDANGDGSVNEADCNYTPPEARVTINAECVAEGVVQAVGERSANVGENVQVRLNGGSWEDATEIDFTWQHMWVGLAPGTYTVEVRIVKDGQVVASASDTVPCGTLPPVCPEGTDSAGTPIEDLTDVNGDEVVDENDCNTPEPPDQCPDGSNPGDANGDGSVNEADCNYTPPVDVCPNIDGNQSEVPEGYEVDGNGNCVEVTTPTTTSPEEPTLSGEAEAVCQEGTTLMEYSLVLTGDVDYTDGATPERPVHIVQRGLETGEVVDFDGFYPLTGTVEMPMGNQRVEVTFSVNPEFKVIVEPNCPNGTPDTTQPTTPTTVDIGTPPTPPTNSPTTLPDGSLPKTGESTGSMLGIALLLAGAGIAIILTTRRQRHA